MEWLLVAALLAPSTFLAYYLWLSITTTTIETSYRNKYSKCDVCSSLHHQA